MSNFEEVFERIKLATNARTQVGLAEVLDIRQSSISDAKRRNSIPADWYMKLFERFGLNPDWLKKGSGPMYLRTELGYAPVESTSPVSAYEDVALYSDPNAKAEVVSIYSMRHWPAPGTADAPKIEGKLSIPLSFAAPSIKVFLLDATSMEPLIRKGAFVALDTAQKQVVSGELYGVYMPHEGLVVKRVYLDATGSSFILRSENSRHPEVTLPVNALAESIAGRVAWALHHL